jgi:hypothetical protein
MADGAGKIAAQKEVAQLRPLRRRALPDRVPLC